MKTSEHVQIKIEPDTLVKEFNPKYKIIEIVERQTPFGIHIGKLKHEKVLEKYGDYTLLSVMDFNDTKTTSFIIKKEKRVLS